MHGGAGQGYAGQGRVHCGTKSEPKPTERILFMDKNVDTGQEVIGNMVGAVMREKRGLGVLMEEEGVRGRDLA